MEGRLGAGARKEGLGLTLGLQTEGPETLGWAQFLSWASPWHPHLPWHLEQADCRALPQASLPVG